jgi:hypothetical protein
VAFVLWGIYEITPVNKQLKGGIDLVGGHSLLYEIDTTGLEDTKDLSTRVMNRLKQRVDPNGVRNLVWRPVGNTRLEIQMPLPPASFSFLVLSLRAQVEMQLGLMRFSEEEKPEPNLDLARHSIDLMAVLLEKTKGNLDIDEQRLLENSLTELRFRFVQVSDEVAKTAAPQA